MTLDPALTDLAAEVEDGSSWPRPLCPHCGVGHLQFGEPQEVESPLSRDMRDHEAWDPDWISGTFAVTAECGNSNCRQVVHAVGNSRVTVASNLVDEYRYSTYYRVTYLNPPLTLMRLPKTVPHEVRDGIDRASALVFADPGFTATAVRAAVERLMTSEGVSAERPRGGFINLHARIEDWRSKGDSTRAGVAELLLAVKWIGNAGSHEVTQLTVKDVLDGIEILNEAFHRLWVGPVIDARARHINAAKGPHRSSPI